MPRFRLLAPLLAVLSLSGLGLAACGGGNDKGFRNDDSAIDGDPSTTLPAALASTKSATARDPSTPLPGATSVTGISTDLNAKPKVPAGKGAAPTELQGTDVVVGSGPAAKAGDTVSVQYVGVLHGNGKQFDASWDNGKKPFSFTVGQGQVIKGWDQGVPGMKVGGRRVLVIPADLAYGTTGSPPTIPANAPLTFVVDLKKIGK
jgi:peptidylprolyl isomerase